MKVIFLDVDGVLNSDKYDRVRTEGDGNIDKSCLPLIKKIVDETGAVIVLSSTWRRHWSHEGALDSAGEELISDFNEAGLEIFGKTCITPENDRSLEIRLWLRDNPRVTHYAVIDDRFFGWEEHEPHTVKTNSFVGIEEKHVDQAIKILLQK